MRAKTANSVTEDEGMIYLDHNATTPVHDRVFEVMVPYLRQHFGNASSFYRIAREAKDILEQSRKNIAACIGAEHDEIVFTSGGTEADNLAIRGAARALHHKGNHIITSSIEHQAVLRTCQALEKEGYRVTYLPVGSQGVVNPDDVRCNIRSDTILISIMYANNETGVIQPVDAIGQIAREADVVFHTDAVQAVGKIPVQVDVQAVDLLSLSAHKMYGPKGTGALYVKRRTPLEPVLTGGPHEYALRAGTENIAGIVGCAAAGSLALASLAEDAQHMSRLRDRFETALMEQIEAVTINGQSAPRISNTSNVSFAGMDSESVLLHLDLRGIYASAGSACTTGSAEPSRVLLAMGLSKQEAQGALRFSFGKDNTEEDIDCVVDALVDISGILRSISSVAV